MKYRMKVSFEPVEPDGSNCTECGNVIYLHQFQYVLIPAMHYHELFELFGDSIRAEDVFYCKSCMEIERDKIDFVEIEIEPKT